LFIIILNFLWYWLWLSINYSLSRRITLSIFLCRNISWSNYNLSFRWILLLSLRKWICYRLWNFCRWIFFLCRIFTILIYKTRRRSWMIFLNHNELIFLLKWSSWIYRIHGWNGEIFVSKFRLWFNSLNYLSWLLWSWPWSIISFNSRLNCIWLKTIFIK
jgi:hypothetical protein